MQIKVQNLKNKTMLTENLPIVVKTRFDSIYSFVRHPMFAYLIHLR